MIRTLILSCLVVPAFAARASGDPTVVMTDAGAVQGTIASDGLRTFLGIPYAAPPTPQNNLRWRPPQPVAPWSGVLPATTFGNVCAQPTTFFQPNPPPGRTYLGDEDCLYLNVYSPAGATFDERVPVMVYLHGGSFFRGSGQEFNAAALADQGDVVAVTINYRLGQFGFLAHPALDVPGGPASGNYGLLDQQFALAWVQRNIAAFGGDPNKVTIFGQSSGAMSVAYHQISPGSAGLFRQAISESGPVLFVHPPTLAQAEAGAGQDVAAGVGCSGTPTQIAQCLRSADPGAILNVDKPAGLSDIHFLPVVDGQILPLAPGQAFKSGSYTHVPLIVGNNHDEGRLGLAYGFIQQPPVYVTPDTYYGWLVETFNPNPSQPPSQQVLDFAAAVEVLYPLSAYPTAEDAFAAVGSDAFVCSIHQVMQLTGAQQGPVFAYEFDDQNAPPLYDTTNLNLPGLPPNYSFSWKAYHASELQYLAQQIGGGLVPVPPPFTAAQWQLSSQMIGYWTTFAWNGHPGNSPLWVKYDPHADNILSLAPQATAFTSNYVVDHKCDFWVATGVYQ
jgi:para-nitrobenzyl esterase